MPETLEQVELHELGPQQGHPLKAERLKKLKDLILKLSYREGDFVLASGKRSKFYIDLKATTLHPEGATLVGECFVDLFETLVAQKKIKATAVGGLTLGADPIATSVSIAAFRRGLFLPAFIVRKESKDHGTSRTIEGTENLKAHAPVIVLEDVVTTGGSSLKAVEHLRAAEYLVDTVFTIVDREQGGRENLSAQKLELYSLFTISELQG